MTIQNTYGFQIFYTYLHNGHTHRFGYEPSYERALEAANQVGSMVSDRISWEITGNGPEKHISYATGCYRLSTPPKAPPAKPKLGPMEIPFRIAF